MKNSISRPRGERAKTFTISRGRNAEATQFFCKKHVHSIAVLPVGLRQLLLFPPCTFDKPCDTMEWSKFAGERILLQVSSEDNFVGLLFTFIRNVLLHYTIL